VIGSTLDIDEVYERFAAEVSKLIPFDRIHVNLNNPDGKSFTITYVSGCDIPGRRPGDKVPLAGSVSEYVSRLRSGIFFTRWKWTRWMVGFPLLPPPLPFARGCAR
jgi:hypothetical protein